MSLFTVMQLVIQHQTSPGQKMAIQQCCIKERHTALLTYRDRLLEITNVQPGMELGNKTILLLQLLYTVSVLFVCLFLYFFISFFIFIYLFSNRFSNFKYDNCTSQKHNSVA